MVWIDIMNVDCSCIIIIVVVVGVNSRICRRDSLKNVIDRCYIKLFNVDLRYYCNWVCIFDVCMMDMWICYFDFFYCFCCLFGFLCVNCISEVDRWCSIECVC